MSQNTKFSYEGITNFLNFSTIIDKFLHKLTKERTNNDLNKGVFFTRIENDNKMRKLTLNEQRNEKVKLVINDDATLFYSYIYPNNRST